MRHAGLGPTDMPWMGWKEEVPAAGMAEHCFGSTHKEETPLGTDQVNGYDLGAEGNVTATEPDPAPEEPPEEEQGDGDGGANS
ncbi:hypothetical protein C9F11_43330 (plasmid) [Streptomyces sp. YIM 121038]|nr:hypothetical protein C9F11_43330 [Streptomyces sp. YIM 121038]